MQNKESASLMLEQITPLIITYNEEANIRRILDRLEWAQRIVVIDSGSTDETLDILNSYSRVDVIYRPFSNFADQCNFGLTQVITPWILSLDADYYLSDEIISELRYLTPSEDTAGFSAGFIYSIYGRPLRGTLYPPRTVLYRKVRAQYQNEGHGHRVIVAGNVAQLIGVIYHDDRKPLARWITSQQRYASEEAGYLLELPKQNLSNVDKLRLMSWPAPIMVLFYTLYIKGCVLDGWPGWYYALQRLCAEVLLALEIIDRRLKRGQSAN
jgi:glycosyltransferase involved in cell wall biosynthesis